MHGIKRFIHVSTDEVYGEGAADQEPMFEDQVLEPTNPYAATKVGVAACLCVYLLEKSNRLPSIQKNTQTGRRRVHRQVLLPVRAGLEERGLVVIVDLIGTDGSTTDES